MGNINVGKKSQKSRQRIINAFLESRAKMDLEKISVTELCKKADVNKSTFYVYYRDVYDLSEQLEVEIVTGILESIEQPEKAFDEPEKFTRNLFMAYDSKKTMINILFSGSRSGELPKKVEASVKELLFNIRPEYKTMPEKAIEFTYIIYGGFYAYEMYKDIDQKQVISVVSSLAAQTVSSGEQLLKL